MKKLRIYLDNCCYNRPYDDQQQLRIELETKAKLFIQQLIVDGRVELISSVIAEYENNDSPYEIRKQAIARFLKNAVLYVNKSSELSQLATQLVADGLKVKDAIHLASAIIGGCDYFISTDDRLLKHSDCRIKLINPVDFITTEVITNE